jgi:hypothetical protein
MANGGLQGWCPDPFGQHEQRYFSLGRPTKLVRDGGAESYDEPPAGTYQAPSRTYEPPAGTYEVPVPQHPGGVGYGPGYARAAGAPRTGRTGMFTVAALMVAAVATLVLVVSRPGSARSSASSPAAFVTRSTQRTLAERSVEITLSETVQFNGESVPLLLAGAVDLGTGAMEVSGAYNYPGRSVAMREIVIGGTDYVALTENGKSVVSDGRHWLRTAVPQGPRADPAYSDPFSSLTVLEHPGNTVQTLGTKTVGGENCTGYAVTPGKQATASYTIWVDGTGLIREFSVNEHWNVQAPPSGTTTVTLVVDITGYGSPVAITPPAASDTFA